MKDEHIACAGKNMAAAIETFADLGLAMQKEAFLDAKRKVTISLLANGPYVVELVAPAAEGSPVDNILDRGGPGCYHICYVTDEMEKDMS